MIYDISRMFIERWYHAKKHDILQTRYNVTFDHPSLEWRADTNDYIHRSSPSLLGEVKGFMILPYYC